MIIVMNSDSTDSQVLNVSNVLKSLGLGVHLSRGVEKTILGIIGDKKVLENISLELLPGVDKVVPIVDSFKLSSKHFNPTPSIVNVNGIEIGGNKIVIMAGPCAVESREQIFSVARDVKKSGACFLRGGAYKPRTSPYAFQGMEEEGLKLLKEAKDEFDLQIISEVICIKSLEIAEKYVDMFQIGARNVQNFQLLKEIGRSKKPTLLKRGPSTTIEEWLNAAEYIMSEGNSNVVLCERGIRTFETATRNTLDLGAIPVVKHLSHLPIIVDPSHAAGKSQYVPALSKAAIACGADGLIIEVHPDPIHALSDAAQQLTPENFYVLCKDIKKISAALGREF